MNTIQAKEAVKYSDLLNKVHQIIDKKYGARNEKLQAVCDLLKANVDEFDWVGFYLANPSVERELILGPFTGEPTEHTTIPYGRGICGQSAETQQTFVVQDVGKAENYLSCSVDVQSEIVVPVMKRDSFVGQIDIDSHTKNAITPEHKKMLEKICDIVATLF